MSFRSQLVSLAAKAKKTRLLDVPFRYNPLVRPGVLRMIDRFAAADLAQRRVLTEMMSRRIVAAARQTPYGREFGPDITSWPILPKTRIRDAPQDFRTKQLFTVPASTGGTTGIPLQLVRTIASVTAEQAFYDVIIRRTGKIWRDARVASLRADNVKATDDWSPPYGIETLAGRRLLLSVPHLNAKTAPWFVERLRDFKPDILGIFPTTGTTLLRLVTQLDLDLSIPLIMCSSERLPEAASTAMAARFGAQVIDYYGHAERAVLSVAEAPNRHFFQPAYGRVELLPGTLDEPTGDFRALSIVATGYWNKAMPMIRYQTGDHALVPRDATAEELEAICLGLAPFHGIAGRVGDFLYLPDGGRLMALDQVPREVEHLLQLQIVQEALDRVTLRALVGPDFGPADRAKLAANAKAKIPASTAVSIEIVDRLDSLPNGKTPFVLRRIDEP